MIMKLKSSGKKVVTLFVLAMACLASSASPIDNEITSSFSSPAKSAVQFGTFTIDNQMITVARVSPPNKLGCVPPESDPCGAFDWCCEGLSCDGTFDGRCHKIPGCQENAGGFCNLGTRCCYPMECSWPRDGECLITGRAIEQRHGSFGAANLLGLDDAAVIRQVVSGE